MSLPILVPSTAPLPLDQVHFLAQALATESISNPHDAYLHAELVPILELLICLASTQSKPDLPSLGQHFNEGGPEARRTLLEKARILFPTQHPNTSRARAFHQKSEQEQIWLASLVQYSTAQQHHS